MDLIGFPVAIPLPSQPFIKKLTSAAKFSDLEIWSLPPNKIVEISMFLKVPDRHLESFSHKKLKMF